MYTCPSPAISAGEGAVTSGRGPALPTVYAGKPYPRITPERVPRCASARARQGRHPTGFSAPSRAKARTREGTLRMASQQVNNLIQIFMSPTREQHQHVKPVKRNSHHPSQPLRAQPRLSPRRRRASQSESSEHRRRPTQKCRIGARLQAAATPSTRRRRATQSALRPPHMFEPRPTSSRWVAPRSLRWRRGSPRSRLLRNPRFARSPARIGPGRHPHL